MAVSEKHTPEAKVAEDFNINLGDSNMADTTIVPGLGGEGGLIGGLILGSLLRNGGNLFGNNGVDGNWGGRGNWDRSVSEQVTEAVGSLMSIQDINEVKRDVKESESAIERAISQSAAALNSTITSGHNGITNTVLQGEIATLQAVNGAQDLLSSQLASGTLGITQAVNATQDSLSNGQRSLAVQIADTAKDSAVAAAMTNANIANSSAITQLAIATTANNLNTNLLQGNYATLAAITNDGDKTRALIQSINTADLNRQITVAENKLAEALGDHRAHRYSKETEVNVSQVVNQAQAQAQQQQQFQTLSNGLAVLLGEIQRNTQSTIAIGSTLTGISQTATNVKQ